MFKNYVCNLVELLLPSRISFLFEPDQSLKFKLDRGKRILDLVSDLTGHLAPCIISFRLSQLPCGIGKIAHHTVICSDKRRNLILAPIYDVFQIIDVRRLHLPSHLNKRREHRIHLSSTEQE